MDLSMSSPMTVAVKRVSKTHIEAQCLSWPIFPTPGYFMEWLAESGNRFYTRVETVVPLENAPGQLYITSTLVSGQPDTRIQAVHLLSGDQFYQKEQDQTEIHIPFPLGELTLDLDDLGPVVVMEPGDSGYVEAVLLRFSQAEFPVLVLDPIGLEWKALPLARCVMGDGWGLSIQQVGVDRFMDWVISAIPLKLQAEAAALLARLLPATPDFIPPGYFVEHPALNESPLASALLHPLYRFHQYGLFSATPQQVLSLPVTYPGIHIDFSRLPPDLQYLAYDGLLAMASRQQLPMSLQVVLVAPKVHMKACRQYIQQTRSRVFLVTRQSQPWEAEMTDHWQQTAIKGSSALWLNGAITRNIALQEIVGDAFASISQSAALPPSPPKPSRTNADRPTGDMDSLNLLQSMSPSIEDDEPGTRNPLEVDEAPDKDSSFHEEMSFDLDSLNLYQPMLPAIKDEEPETRNPLEVDEAPEEAATFHEEMSFDLDSLNLAQSMVSPVADAETGQADESDAPAKNSPWHWTPSVLDTVETPSSAVSLPPDEIYSVLPAQEETLAALSSLWHGHPAEEEEEEEPLETSMDWNALLMDAEAVSDSGKTGPSPVLTEESSADAHEWTLNTLSALFQSLPSGQADESLSHPAVQVPKEEDGLTEWGSSPFKSDASPSPLEDNLMAMSLPDMETPETDDWLLPPMDAPVSLDDAPINSPMEAS
jgi:hypothetical protein